MQKNAVYNMISVYQYDLLIFDTFIVRYRIFTLDHAMRPLFKAKIHICIIVSILFLMIQYKRFKNKKTFLC